MATQARERKKKENRGSWHDQPEEPKEQRTIDEYFPEEEY
jgi:hypothetical protein